MRRPLIVLIAGAVALSACGTVGGDSSTTDEGLLTTTSMVTTSPDSSSSTTGTASGATSSTSVVTSTSLATTTTSATTTTTDAPISVEGPIPGPTWIVVGVAHDDTLNVRADPGTGAAIVGELAPTAAGIDASGAAMQVGSVIWWEISTPTVVGWVSSRYLAAAGATDDIASAIVDANGGVLPVGETMEELADLVLALSPADDAVVIAAATVGGEFGEITIDAFDDGDDAIRGRRLHIFGQRAGGSAFSLYAVESTSLCWRAVDGAGLCV